MGRISRGWKLAKIAFGVVRTDSALLTLSVLGGLAALFVALAFLIPATVLYDREQTAVAVVLLVVGAYLATFLGVYFGVALAAAAAKVLDGQDATVADGLSAARTRLGPIAGWALFALTVNLVIAFIRERAGVAGDVLAGIAGVAWGLVTFLVIPVIALEGLGPWAAVKRSGSLFRKRWGEQITGNFAIGAIFLLAGLVPAFVLGAIGWVSENEAVAIPLFAIAVVLAVAAIILARTVGSVFAVALYRFAATGAATGPFSEEDLRGSVSARPAALGQGI